MLRDDHLLQVKDYIIKGWPLRRNEIPEEQRPNWAFTDERAVIYGILMEGK